MRHWVVSACHAEQSLPHGNSYKSIKNYSSRCKGKPRPAHVCRLRSGFNPHREGSLWWWGLRNRTLWDRLCARCINDWFMPYLVSLGKVLKNKGRCQASFRQHDRGWFVYSISLDEIPLSLDFMKWLFWLSSSRSNGRVSAICDDSYRQKTSADSAYHPGQGMEGRKPVATS